MRLWVGLWALGIAWAGPDLPSRSQKLEAFQNRRVKLEEALPDGLSVFFGRTEGEEDLRTSFYQEPNFFYLTGWTEPGAILILAPLPGKDSATYAAASALPREILFLPRRDPAAEKWTGRKADPEDKAIRGRTGFEQVMPAEQMESQLRKMLELYPRIYTLKNRPESKKLEALAPLRPILSAEDALKKLRMKKSPEELAAIEKSTAVSIAAHKAAWQRAAPGLHEYQIAATMSSVILEQGCERLAYAPIIGSGPNAITLHYSQNSRLMDRGELLLMDVGAECSGYVTDITRTIPVGARFSKRQREIYEIVLGAQKATIAAVKPGMTLAKTSPNTLYKIAYDYINSHGKDLHGEPLGKYFTHGIGHHVGLQVHDLGDPALPLEAGMVITVEPGIYLPEEGIGVRIEDVVLVTESGAKVLSDALPRDPGEIERALAK